MPGKAVLARCNRAKLLRTKGRFREAMDELSQAEALLDAGADPNLRCEAGKNALDHALEDESDAGHQAVIEMLRRLEGA